MVGLDPPSIRTAEPVDEDQLRILVATDNHVGYDERQKWGEDALNTLREILQLAREREVDLVLLGGDLYDKNRPSRLTEMRTVELFKEFVMGDRPIAVEYVSDPRVNFGERGGRTAEVNFMDANLNIGLPVFSIHGNHDDPVGAGEYSALDLLHTTGLVNYFGRVQNPDPTGAERVDISPVLLRRGRAQLALYGMSAISNDRAHRLFAQGMVQFLQPAEAPEDWLNLFVVHQNRAEYSPKSHLPTEYLPDLLDLVIWGHEHDCRIEPEQIVNRHGQPILISQPGSSVATSLIAGEAQPKHVGLLTINARREFKMEALPLKTVRPMIIRHLNIEKELSHKLQGTETEKRIQEDVDKYLRQYVTDLLENELPNLLTGHPLQPSLPRVQVKIEYSDPMYVINPVRFGSHFSHDVAQPDKLLMFKSKRQKIEDGFDGKVDIEFLESLQCQSSSIADHVTRYFENRSDDKTKLKLLCLENLKTGVTQYVNKEYKRAIEDVVELDIDHTVNALLSLGDEDINDEFVDGALGRLRDQKEKLAAQGQDPVSKFLEKRQPTAPRGNGTRETPLTVGESDEESETTPEAPIRGRGRGARSRGRAPRARGRATTSQATGKKKDISSFFTASSSPASARRSSRSTAANQSLLYDDEDD